MKNRITIVFFISWLLSSYNSTAGEIKAGVARIVITPELPMWLTGYASREKPAAGIIHDLWAKALVLEENADSRVVIVTTDLLGLSHEISEEVARRAEHDYGIKRSQLILNSSHTHSGPMVWPCLDVIYDFDVADQQMVSAYGHRLTENIIKVIGMAMKDRSPAIVFSAHTSAGFAINRRDKLFPKGSTDHDVPVLKITAPDGSVRAVFFGYACHNTTIVDDNYLFNGDYAGFAQLEIEKNNPGSIALFMMGCGGDQNPDPRGTVALAQQYGKSLADSVQKSLETKMRPVTAPIRTSYTVIDIDFRPFNIQQYQNEIVSTDKFLQRRAKLMLEAYNKGWPVNRLHYPVQAVRFGNSFTLIALSDEVVVDYSLRTKKEFSGENIYVAGYSTEVMCYIPSLRVLKEGGYEGESNMIYYGFPGPFADNVEEQIFKAIRKVMKNTGSGMFKK